MLQQKLHVVIGVITNEKQQVLLAQRTSKQHLAGYWEFPGGKVEPMELAEQALHRELYEELGIEVIKKEPWMQYEYTYLEQEILFNVWRVYSFKGEAFGKENQRIAWYNFDELNQLKMPPANQRIILSLIGQTT